jgi:hypothetical protein
VDYGGSLRLAPLDERGDDFVRARLHDGKSLAAAMLSSDLSAWTSYALVGQGLAEEDVYVFNGSAVPQLPRDEWQPLPGGMLAQEVTDTSSQLVPALATRLRALPGSFLVVEDWYATPDEADVPVAPWLFAEEVYLTATGDDESRLEQVMIYGESAAWPRLFAAVCTAPPAAFAGCDQTASLGEGDVQALARSVVEVWVGAYDGESYLLWTCEDPRLHYPAWFISPEAE